MRAIYKRCDICSHWYSPIARNHCDVCGCTKVLTGTRRSIMIDVTHATRPGIAVFKGVHTYKPATNMFAKD